MRIEVHVHGTVHLRAGVRATEINDALQPWLEYIDVDSIDEVKSIHHDEPGLMLDTRAMRFETVRYGWDPANPLSGTNATAEQSMPAA